MSLDLAQSPTIGFPVCASRSAFAIRTPRLRLSTFVPDYVLPCSVECQDVDIMQRLDQLVAMVKEQSKEMISIKEQVDLSAEVQQLKTFISSCSLLLMGPSASGTSTTVRKKLPTQLSVSYP